MSAPVAGAMTRIAPTGAARVRAARKETDSGQPAEAPAPAVPAKPMAHRTAHGAGPVPANRQGSAQAGPAMVSPPRVAVVASAVRMRAGLPVRRICSVRQTEAGDRARRARGSASSPHARASIQTQAPPGACEIDRSLQSPALMHDESECVSAAATCEMAAVETRPTSIGTATASRQISRSSKKMEPGFPRIGPDLARMRRARAVTLQISVA